MLRRLPVIFFWLFCWLGLYPLSLVILFLLDHWLFNEQLVWQVTFESHYLLAKTLMSDTVCASIWTIPWALLLGFYIIFIKGSFPQLAKVLVTFIPLFGAIFSYAIDLPLLVSIMALLAFLLGLLWVRWYQ